MRVREYRARPKSGETVGWTYAVPGVLSWSIIIGALVGVWFFPQAWAWIATVFVGYLMCYSLTYYVFALVGEYKRRQWAKVDWTEGADEVGPFGFAPSDVYHAVIVPNYKEPLDVLERTVASVAAQHHAKDRIVLVLAMEEREARSREKGEALAARYSDAFLKVMVTVHPANLPGELACKAANQTWASIEARRTMVDEMGLPLDRITLSTCDADSVFHPSYFAAVARSFAADERRHSRIWQAPLLYYNNIWDVPSPIRYTAWFIHAGQMAELAMPFYDPLPISTYTVSMQLSEDTQWWDPAVISEDWHVYLGVMFARDGDVSVTPIFLPTLSDATDGPTPIQAIINRYLQVLRHSWGAEDVGFLLKTMIAERRIPRPLTAFRSAQVLHDHVMRVASWVVVMTGYALDFGAARPVWAQMSLYETIITSNDPLHIVLRYFFIMGAIVIGSSTIVELIRNPAPKGWGSVRLALEVLLMWLTAPLVGFFLGTAPAVHAQTKLMLGLPLAWRVTPKHLVERLSDAA